MDEVRPTAADAGGDLGIMTWDEDGNYLCRHENQIFEITERFQVHPESSYVRCSDCRQRFILTLGAELCSHMASTFDSHWRRVYEHSGLIRLPHCGSCQELVIHIKDVSGPLAAEFQASLREQNREEQDQRNLRNLTEAMTASRHINEDPETCAHQDHVEIPTPGPRTNAMCSYCGAILIKWRDPQTMEWIVEPENEERAARIVRIYSRAIELGGSRDELYRRFNRVYGPPSTPVEVWYA